MSVSSRSRYRSLLACRGIVRWSSRRCHPRRQDLAWNYETDGPDIRRGWSEMGATYRTHRVPRAAYAEALIRPPTRAGGRRDAPQPTASKQFHISIISFSRPAARALWARRSAQGGAGLGVAAGHTRGRGSSSAVQPHRPFIVVLRRVCHVHARAIATAQPVHLPSTSRARPVYAQRLP